MEPIPETASLIDEFGEHFDPGLLDELQRKAGAVTELVPDLVGLSVARLDDGVAFTLVATDLDVAVLDAVQYVAGGPCVDAVPQERVVEFDAEDPDDEGVWESFARATAAKAVATTLTLPILERDQVVGTVNMYAARRGAFRGLHQEIAEIFSAWAPGAVTNADLSFRTRKTAEESLRRWRSRARVEAAIGLLMATRSIGENAARALLEESAQRAGVSSELLAEIMLEAFEQPEED